MNAKVTVRSFAVTFTLLCLLILTPVVSAQCVKCKSSGGRFVCGPSANGGCECSPVMCEDCVVSIPCPGPHPCDRTPALTGLGFDVKLIREVAQRHPRFAIMLASLNKTGGLKGWARVSSMPARLDSSEVENWLKPRAEAKEFFQEYQKRRVPGADPVEYEFTLEGDSKTRGVVRGKVLTGFPDDPAGTQLRIEIENEKVARWEVY
jgi:hypothetical protein